MRQVPVAVVGPGADVPDRVLADAVEVGRLLAEAGYAVVTGGLGGVMDAASRGAAAAGGTVIALLPGEDAEAANPHASVVVATGLGQGRNVLVVGSAAAVVAVGGSWGTLSEVAIAMRLGKPVVWLHGWAVEGPAEPVPTAATPADAVDGVVALLQRPGVTG